MPRTTGGAIAESSFGTVAIASDLIQTPLSLHRWRTVPVVRGQGLIFTTQVADNSIFRLPARVPQRHLRSSFDRQTRIRAVHLAETPNGLDKV